MPPTYARPWEVRTTTARPSGLTPDSTLSGLWPAYSPSLPSPYLFSKYCAQLIPPRTPSSGRRIPHRRMLGTPMACMPPITNASALQARAEPSDDASRWMPSHRWRGPVHGLTAMVSPYGDGISEASKPWASVAAGQKLPEKMTRPPTLVKLTGHPDQRCYLVMPRSRRWSIRSRGQVWTRMDMRVSRVGMHPELLAQ
jgi:hypothetical protein